MLLHKMFLVLALCIPGLCAYAAEQPKEDLETLEFKAPVDGLHDDSLWQNITEHELRYSIIDGGSPRFRTTYKILYDSEHLYFEITAFDNDGAQIRQKFSLRDQPLMDDDDRVTISLDPIGNRKFGQVFGVNAACVPYDAVIDEVNAYMDMAPQFNFIAECAHFADRWRVRFQIPFSEIKYKESPSRMTLLVDRRYLRESPGLLASSHLEYFGSCLLCEAYQIELNTPPKKTSIKAVVEAFGSQADNDGERHSTKNLGLTISVPLDIGTTVDGTYHPDYSQVEADTPYLTANSPFPNQLTENRPFFLEGNDVLFSSSMTSAQSRSIVSPTYGLKLLSRHENIKIFSLIAGDRSSVFRLVPGRYASQFIQAKADSQNMITRVVWNTNDQLSLGLSVNGKQERTFHENYVWGPDLTWKINQQNKVYLQILDSYLKEKETQELEEEVETSNRKKTIGLGYEYAGDFNIVGLNIHSIDSGFVNDLGFMPQNGSNEIIGYSINSTQWKLPSLAITDFRIDTSASQMIEDQSKRVMARGAELSGTVLTAKWVSVGLIINPISDHRVGSDTELHHGSLQRLKFTIKPPQAISLAECTFQKGHILVYSEDSLGQNHNSSCRINFALGLHVSGEIAQDLDQYVVDSNLHRLTERLQSGTFRYFIDRENFIRLTLQSRALDSFDERQRDLQISWLIGHQHPQGLSVYVGLNRLQSKADIDETSREYFAKLSYAL